MFHYQDLNYDSSLGRPVGECPQSVGCLPSEPTKLPEWLLFLLFPRVNDSNARSALGFTVPEEKSAPRCLRASRIPYPCDPVNFPEKEKFSHLPSLTEAESLFDQPNLNLPPPFQPANPGKVSFGAGP